MHELNQKLKEMLSEYNDKAKKKELSAGDLQIVHVLSDSIKNLDKIEALEDGGYSEATDFMGEGRMYGTSYDDGMSYARGRRYAKRDSMGRYSRDGSYHDGSSYEGGSSYARGRRGYSRDGGVKEGMIEKLEDMMEDAGSEKERQAIRQCIQKLENA